MSSKKDASYRIHNHYDCNEEKVSFEVRVLAYFFVLNLHAIQVLVVSVASR